MRPNLPARVFTGEFWHAHFNYAALRTDPALAAIGSMDGLAGDQICQWNSVAPDSILPATHLSVFVPPPLGAFVLANHQNHEDFKSTPASATHSSPIFSVQQNIQFPLPQVFSNQDELLSLARLSAAEGYLSEEVIPFLGHSNQQMTFKKVRWALRFPLPPPSKDPAARRFSSTPAFRQGPRSGEALDGAIRVAAPLTYANEDSVHLQQSHFLKLPSFDGIYGKITRNVNPSPPDEHIVRWLRAQAPRLAQRDEGDKSAIPLGLYAFFCGNISLPQVVELIKARHSHDEKSVQLMRNQFRNNKVELHIPRLPHPLHAVRTQQALASGVQPPPTPLPEGFELDPPVTSQLHQPASARGQAPKRPAPETPASTVSEGLPSGPLSPAPPSQFSTHSSDPPLTAYSGPSRTPVGAHPYQRAPPPAGKGKGTESGKGKGSGPSYADIASKGKKGQKGQKGQKGPNPKGNKGQKGQKGEYAGPILEGGKGPAKGDSK